MIVPNFNWIEFKYLLIYEIIKVSMETFESFHDLSKSKQFEDQVIYDYLIKLLDSLFGKHDEIIIDAECESEKNQQLIKNQSKILIIYFHIPKRVFSTQKCVRQILKHIIDNLNTRYQFKQPIQFNLKKNYSRIENKVIGSCHTVISLI
jgi:hypothetical protein